MMSDIRTVEVVTVDDMKVRVAEQETGDRYDAAVVEIKKDPIGRAMGGVFGDSSDYYSVDDAPIADHKRKFIAVGKAVEQYLDGGEESGDGE